MLDPDGREAAREPDDPPASVCRSLTVPARGKAGVYLLRCVAIDEKALRPGERPRLCMLPTATDGLVYPAMTAPGAGPGFAARAWFVGLPARTEGAALTYTHRHGIFCADIPFVVTRADGAWRLSSADLAWRHYGGFDTFRYTFPLPSSDKPEVFRCGLDYRPHAAAHSPDGAAPGGYAVEEAFSVRTAPPFVSASPDAWFDPGPHTAP